MNKTIKIALILSIFVVLAPFRFTDAAYLYPPTIIEFGANPTHLTTNSDGTTLYWTTVNADYCRLTSDNDSSGLPTTQVQENSQWGPIKPSQTTTYALTCSKSSTGSTPARAFVTVTVGTAAPTPTPTPQPTPTPYPTQQPPVNSGSVLSANTNNVLPGQQVILSWYSTNADWCTASDGWSGPKPLSGSQPVYPYYTTTYKITCSNATGGTASDWETIYVNQPVPQPTPTPPPPQGLGAACAISPSIPRVGNLVTFTAVESGGTFPYYYSWTGDASGTSKSISRTFSTAGTKFATVRITDAYGRVSNGSCSVEVLPAAPPPRPTPTPGQVQGATTVCKTVNVPVTVCVDQNGKTVETPPPSGTPTPTPTQIVPTPSPSPTTVSKTGTTTKSFLASIFSVSDNTWAKIKSLLKWYLAILAIILVVAIAYFVIKRLTGKDVK